MSQHEEVVLVLLDALALPPLGVEGRAVHPGAAGREELSGGAGQAAAQVHHGTEDVEGEVPDAGQGFVGHVVTLQVLGAWKLSQSPALDLSAVCLAIRFDPHPRIKSGASSNLLPEERGERPHPNPLPEGEGICHTPRRERGTPSPSRERDDSGNPRGAIAFAGLAGQPGLRAAIAGGAEGLRRSAAGTPALRRSPWAY